MAKTNRSKENEFKMKKENPKPHGKVESFDEIWEEQKEGKTKT
ncbi:hypothetical protein VQL36_02905 [Chengkuizengella sp. SCS-71B]